MVSFLWGTVNSADPDQTPHDAASDLDLHCLLTACSIKIKKKLTNPLHGNRLIQ